MTTPNAQQEIAALARIALDAHRDPTDRAEAVLVAHQRRDIGSCICGWSQIGKSHAGHQVAEMVHAGLFIGPQPDEAAPDLEPAPSAATIASVMAIVDGPYRPGLDVQFEGDDL